MNKLKQLWSHLRGSFWFLPSLIVAGSIAIALALIQVDITVSREWMSRWPRLFGAGAAGARGVLSAIAGSMMTVVGVTFSMTLVTLVLASRYISATHRYEDGVLRLITIGPTFASLVGKAFGQIRKSATDNLAVFLEILGGLQIIASLTNDASRRQVLREQADYLAKAAKRTLSSPHDLARFEHRLRQIKTKF